MSWNYRIIHHKKTDYYALHEVYYNDETGSIESWTEKAASAVADTKDEVISDLHHMLRDAIKREVIEMED